MQQFRQYLEGQGLSKRTVESYIWTANYFNENYDGVNRENLLAYKGYLMEFFKPKTVNLRIQAMNKYLDFIGMHGLRLKAVRIQQKSFLENVISNADYSFLKQSLKEDGNDDWYFVVWFLGTVKNLSQI